MNFLRTITALFLLGICYDGFCQKQGFQNFAELQKYLSYSPDKKTLISAHRGGATLEFPENCLETFAATLQACPTCIIECDIRLTKDSVLVLMHDENLERTTSGQGKLQEYTFEQIKALQLKTKSDKITTYRVPTLMQTLAWAKGKTILMLDVKKGVPYKLVVDAIQKAQSEAYSVVIVYQAEAAQQVYQLAPNLMLSCSIYSIEDYGRYHALKIPDDRMIAFTGVAHKKPELYEFLHQKGILCSLGTMHNIDNKALANGIKVFEEIFDSGVDMLATDIPVFALKAIK